MNDIEIQDTKAVWVAWTNTDCTEGRGLIVPKAVCDSEATAIRLGRKGSVQGSDCNVSAGVAIQIDNEWLVPGRIIAESKEDIKAQKKVNEKRDVIEKAKAAGLTEYELTLLGN
ncbi:hypothetical protein KAR91_68130 [Candidatus Pacearchaeota archaeon]|nr:hypothetical protein [Candidatus Pacearchaeota archaeon]